VLVYRFVAIVRSHRSFAAGGMFVIVMHLRAREQIRTARTNRGLSLRELGRRVGVSASLLSQIENGKSDPSVSTLYALVAELDLSLDALLGPDLSAVAAGAGTANGASQGTVDAVSGAGSSDFMSSAQKQSPVVPPGERRILQMDSGVVWERLTRGPSELLDALLVTYEPGGTSSSSAKLMTHSGLEFAYLMEGELTLHLGFEAHTMKAGDSLEFEAATPHLYYNAGTVPARGLWYVLGNETFPAQGGIRPGLVGLNARARRPSSAVEVLQAFSGD
jgi:transcriptional regulator with XRE-family HTH domain/mannose-6-phosphate isomerase-like protein (cupin superfamily)